jgi:alpha-methylacyl-CoA racemase
MPHSPDSSRGPLHGLRIVELAGIGPVPHAATLFADLGADVVRVQRPGQAVQASGVCDQTLRGRRIVEADLKDPADIESILDLVERADILLEGFRPGTTERLGLGPDRCAERNPRLIYGRMTGWGQDGPLADRAGHDINYIAVTGLLHAIGRAGERPVPPLNLVGDFGGGSMFLLVGVLSALHEREQSGRGQVVDAAMVDGALALSHFVWSLRGDGRYSDERGVNLVDGGAPFYDAYETSDGKFVAVGAMEPQFYSQFVAGLGLDESALPDRMDRQNWDSLRSTFADLFRTRTRDDWAKLFAPTDACVSPVLTFAEAPEYEHIAVRESLTELDGVVQHAPAPRFSRTRPARPVAPATSTVEAESVWR